MSRTCVGRVITFLAFLALSVTGASAQSVRIDQLVTFKAPYVVISGAVAQVPDGRTFGFYSGGFNGAVYQATPDGHGGYSTTVVLDIPNAGDIPMGPIAAASDGKIYFVGTNGLSRFDPDTLTVQDLVDIVGGGYLGFPVALSVGNDGHTLFGAFSLGTIYSYDTTTSTYRAVGNTGDLDLIGLVQMKDGSLLTTTEGFGVTELFAMRKLDPTTGAPLAPPIVAPIQFTEAYAPTKGDDGETYVMTRNSNVVIDRVDPACFCLQQLVSYPDPATINLVTTIAGPRNGKLYLDANGIPSSLDISVNPPVLTPLTALQNVYNYRLLPDGTLVMFGGSAYALGTDTAVPNATPTPSFAPFVPNDGVNSFPDNYTQGSDGMLYGFSDGFFYPQTGVTDIYRVDPVARTKTRMNSIAGLGQRKMVLGADGELYYTDSSINHFDSTTGAVDTLRSFPTDPNTGQPGPDGAFPGRLRLGTDGLLHGVMDEGDTPDFSGGVFTFDPASGSYSLVTVTTFAFGFFPTDPMVEVSPGVWIGIYNDYDFNSSGCGKTFRFDQATSIVTSLGPFGDGTLCPETFARSAGGTIVGTALDLNDPNLGYIVFTLDPGTGAVTRVAPLPQSPEGDLVLAADDSLYFAYTSHDGFASGVFRFNPSTSQLTDFGTVPGAAPSYGVTLGRDGRIFLGTFTPWYLYSFGVLDSIPVTPASGGVDQTTTLSATLKAIGVPLAGRTIAFTLNGHTVGSATTNAQGVATLNNVNLFGIAIGTYPNAIGASFAGDDEFPSTSGTGSLTVIDVPTPGLMIGDGFIRDQDFRYDFAFLVREQANGDDRGGFALRIANTDCPPKGRKKPAPRNDTFVSTSYSNVVFSDDPTIRPGKARRPQVDTVQFAGPGLWDGKRGYRFEATAQDAGEPGRHRESIGVTVFDGANNVVAQFDGTLDGGNIQSIRIKH